jgi:hypothetical protein
MPFWSFWGSFCSLGIKLPTAFVMVALLLPVGTAVVWGDDAHGDLSWGERLALGNYTIEAADFFAAEDAPSRVVLIVHSEDLPEESRRVLQAGEGFELDDRLKVVLEQVRIEGLEENRSSAKVRMWIPAAPEITLFLIPEKDFYFGGEDIILELKAKNTGLVAAEGLKVTLESRDIPSIEALRKSVLSPGETWKEDGETVSMKLQAPYLNEPGLVTISAVASFEDSEGTSYQSPAQTSFRVAGPLQLHKRFDEKQRFGKKYFVVNTLRNTGNRSLSVTLEDFAGSSFKARSSLNWNLLLGSGKTEVISYALEANRPGIALTLPASKASYSIDGRNYEVESESPVVDVVGPSLEVVRKANPERLLLGEVTDVVMVFENIGNRYAAVTIENGLPEVVRLVEGDTSGSFSLGPGEKKTLSYRLKCLQAGRLKLPLQNISYRDVQGNEYQTSCPVSTIVVEEEPEQPEPELQEEVSDESSQEEEAPEETGSPFQMAVPLAIVLIISLVFSRYL